ncbi:MAG: ATP-binding cassette domain-containing protein [Gammaproteobacteria bacterium]|nr:ATP-binding cassette domain-containing protein [Gammaproteobacteria bacterium]
MSGAVVALEHVSTAFHGHVIHEDISLTVNRKDILGLVGGSGSGKTTLMREMVGLMQPTSGRVRLFGAPLDALPDARLAALRNRCGVLFQAGALFSALTVFENIAFPLREVRTIDQSFIRDLVYMKLALVGLDSRVAVRLPAELSGGMIKRVALARALALEPELLFLDEPTSGLDAVTAETFVDSIASLQSELGFTVVVVTHDLDLVHDLCSQLAILADRRLVAHGPPQEVMRSAHPFVQSLRTSIRGQRVFGAMSYP